MYDHMTITLLVTTSGHYFVLHYKSYKRVYFNVYDWRLKTFLSVSNTFFYSNFFQDYTEIVCFTIYTYLINFG